MPLAKNLLVQVGVLTAVGTAFGLADLVIRGGDLQTSMEVSDDDDFFGDVDVTDTPPATPEDVSPETDTSDATAAPDAPVVDTGDSAEPVEVVTKDPEPAVDPTPASAPAPGPMDEPDVLPEGHISLAQAYGMYTNDAATFIDARPARDYVVSHIAGSWHFPVSAFDNGDPMKLYELDAIYGMDRPLIIYCSGGSDCEAAEDVAIQFQMSGFSRIRILHVGMPGWEAAGYPTGSGEDPNG